jgi:murein DD-endopeptidase MepM/ murein hydrolase activator NlpD
MRGPHAMSVAAGVASAFRVSQVAAAFVNAPYLSDLLAVLEHPVSAQQPDLRHFRALGVVLAKQSGQLPGSYRSSAPTPPVQGIIGLGVFVVLLGGSIGAILPWGRRRWRHNAATALGLILLPALLSGSLATRSAPTPAVEQHLAPASATLPAPYAGLTRATPATWAYLVTIEQAVTSHQDHLAVQERQIAQVVDAVTAHAGEQRPNTDRLPSLLEQHKVSLEALSINLKREYDFYRAVAQEPEERDRLLTAASVATEPAALDAVNYNLALIQTQLTQEAAIQAAEAKLAAIGSLSATQLGALHQHQPFIVPVVGAMTQGFGPTDLALEPPMSIGGAFYPHFHSGLDIAAAVDSPIHAAADGVVLLATATVDSAGQLVGYGNYVVIGHPDGFVTLYGHLNSTAVHEGQVVHQGEIIGQEGSTGLSTGPHLHFEIRHNGEFLDPAPYLATQLG